MSSYKYPFILLVILSLFSTFWFSSNIANYSNLLVDKLDAESEFVPFQRKRLDSSERMAIIKFIDETNVKAAIFNSQNYTSSDRSQVIATAIRTTADAISFKTLYQYLLHNYPENIKLVAFFFQKSLQSAIVQQVPQCQTTTTSRCWLRFIDLLEYSSYIAKNTIYQLYKPLAVRLLLVEYDDVMWLDPLAMPTKAFEPFLPQVLNNSQYYGATFLPATHGLPTSAFTHPATFKYFGFKPDYFYFHRMISSRFFVFSRNHQFAINITNDWLSCCSDPDCVWPLGSRSSGCMKVQPPEFKYTGCHAGEQSALNIALARLPIDIQMSLTFSKKSSNNNWFVPTNEWNMTTTHAPSTAATDLSDDDDDDFV